MSGCRSFEYIIFLVNIYINMVVFFQRFNVPIHRLFKQVTTHLTPEFQVVLWSTRVMLGITWLREWRAGVVVMRDSGWERSQSVKVSYYF